MGLSILATLMEDERFALAVQSRIALRSAHSTLRNDFPQFTPESLDAFIAEVMDRSVYGRVLKQHAKTIIDHGAVSVRRQK